MKYNTYLFDFDGVLVDSMPVFITSMLSFLDKNNIEYGDEVVKTITPLGYRGAIKYLKELGVTMPEDEMLAVVKKNIFTEYLHNIPAKEYVCETLKALKNDGAELNILSASPHVVLDVCLERVGIKDLFSNILSTDDFGKRKNDPEIYYDAIQRLGKGMDEILFLDDNVNALKAAKEAGLKICGVFDASSANYADDIKAMADHYIYDFSELR